MFLPYITQSTRIRDSRKILFDTIFSNTLIGNIISGNLTATISDHLPQSIIIPNIFSNPPSNKSDIYERDWSHFVQENVMLDFFPSDWNSLVKNNKDVNFSFNNLFKRINPILDSHTIFRKVTEKKLRFRSKQWKDLGLKK